MKRVQGTIGPVAFLFAAALCGAVASPLAAQQATVPAPATEAAATPVSPPTTPLPGPRVRAELRPVEAPSFSESRESSLRHRDNQTITVNTLVLVLAVVILVLLIR